MSNKTFIPTSAATRTIRDAQSRHLRGLVAKFRAADDAEAATAKLEDDRIAAIFRQHREDARK